MHYQQLGLSGGNNVSETEMQAEPSPRTSAVPEAAAQHTPPPPDPEPPACPMESSEEPAPASTSKGE